MASLVHYRLIRKSSDMEMDSRPWPGTAIVFVLLLVCGCDSDESQEPDAFKSASTDSVMVMKLQSTGFANGAKLDAKYTVEGQDISPPLSWSEAPTRTMSFALIREDPDAPSPRSPAAEPWVHWIIFNIPGERSDLPQRIGREKVVQNPNFRVRP